MVEQMPGKIKKWKLKALDKFMSECGDATAYTATVSKNFTISELFAINRFMYTKDTKRLLQMAHERFEQIVIGLINSQKQMQLDIKESKASYRAIVEILASLSGNGLREKFIKERLDKLWIDRYK